MRIIGGVLLFRQPAIGLTLRDCPQLEVSALPPIFVNAGWSAIKTLAAQIKVGLCARCVVRARMATATWRAHRTVSVVASAASGPARPSR
jgi:hypothetical protein